MNCLQNALYIGFSNSFYKDFGLNPVVGGLPLKIFKQHPGNIRSMFWKGISDTSDI